MKELNSSEKEIARLNKIIEVLMNRAERGATLQGSDFNLFQTAVILENKVNKRTEELEKSLKENERITRNLRESENRNRLLVENSPMGIHEIDAQGRLVSMNHAGVLMHGFKEESEVKGSLYLDTINEVDKQRISKLFANSFNGISSHFEYKAAQSKQIFKSCFVPIRNDENTIERVMGIMEDITERKKTEEYINSLAFYDTLTRLPNRRLLQEHLLKAMQANKRTGRYGAVIFLDLDNFKSLNDTHGHDMGDALLIEVGERITKCVREMDTVARFGGDEFVVMLSEFTDDYETSSQQAGVIAEKIRVSLAKPFVFQIKQESTKDALVEHFCTASIGVTMFKDNDSSSEEIFKKADLAMYESKDAGCNRVTFSK
jgi:diguanylate cyclase (GGDEF)-like protein/PAS domain S-box-containing protein